MTKTQTIATAALFAFGAVVLAAPVQATTPVTSDSLMAYCHAEKERRGLSASSVEKIVVSVDYWGQPDLRCLVSAPEKDRWLTALPASVCQEVAGNSRWFMRAYRVYCGAPEVEGRTISMPHDREPIAIPQSKPDVGGGAGLRRPNPEGESDVQAYLSFGHLGSAAVRHGLLEPRYRRPDRKRLSRSHYRTDFGSRPLGEGMGRVADQRRFPPD